MLNLVVENVVIRWYFAVYVVKIFSSQEARKEEIKDQEICALHKMQYTTCS
jgi:hypothetical protein